MRLLSQAWVLKDEVPSLARLKTELTVQDRYKELSVNLWSENGRWLGLPMFHFRFHDGAARQVVDDRATGRTLGMAMRSPYRPGQDGLMTEFARHVDNGMTGFIVQAPPGFGKTVVGLFMLALLDRTALVVVPRSNLITQWRERILEHTDLKSRDIGEAQDGRATWFGKKIVIGLVHTLAMDRFGEKFMSSFGTVVFDEVDRSVPPQTFAPVAGLVTAKYRIGLSATMQRPDGMETVFEKHLGQVFLKGADFNRMAPKVVIHQFWGFSGNVYGHTTLTKRGQLISRLAGNEERTAVIARYVKMILVSGRRVCVLSDRIEQLVRIKSLLVSNGWAGDREVGFYVRGLPVPKKKRLEKQRVRTVSPVERERVANVCKVILGTYGMFSIGTDIKDLAGLVYATPQSDVAQSKGRIERWLEGKLQPVVVDIVDMKYPMAVRWGKKRESSYRLENLIVKKVRA